MSELDKRHIEEINQIAEIAAQTHAQSVLMRTVGRACLRTGGIVTFAATATEIIAPDTIEYPETVATAFGMIGVGGVVGLLAARRLGRHIGRQMFDK